MKRFDLSKLNKRAQAEVARQLGQAGEPVTKAFQVRRRGKYGNEKDEGADSRLEARRGKHLKLLAKAGEIQNLQRQVRVDLHVGKRYMRLDYVYLDVRLGIVVYEDVKGFMTTDWSIKRDIWAAGFGPGLLRIVRRQGGSWVHEDIYPAVNPEALRILIDNARRTMPDFMLRDMLDVTRSRQNDT